MASRISNLRITQARQYGRIVGRPPDEAEAIALVADLLMAVCEPRDLRYAFEGVRRHKLTGFKVQVTDRWWIAFEWMDGVGTVDLRLLE